MTSAAHTEQQPMAPQERIHSRALEAAAYGIVLTDTAGKILFANRAFCAMTGYAAEEILGQTLDFLKSGEHDAGFFWSLWETVLSGQVWQGELTNRRKDGTLYQEEMIITPIRGTDGEISHFIAIKQDITKRKQREERRHQAQRMEAIGKLAGNIAQDFTNLLTVIHGNAELVLADNGWLKDYTRRHLKQIADATERAADLTRQLLAFGRKQIVQTQAVDLNQVIGNYTKMLNRVIGEAITLRCHFAKYLPSVNADVGMIEQILINLIVNARDAMPRGGAIDITTEAVTLDAAGAEIQPEARPGKYLAITISDTGTGIYPEYLPRIFEPFFTTKQPGTGAGLGLATVYGIVKQHQGWIDVSSQLGQGTTFKIFLPANPPDTARAAISQAKPVRAAGQEKILLVEDDDDVRMVTRDVLEESGYQIWDAANGSEALNIWNANASKFDLLLTDIVMPGGLNGWELAARLRKERSGLKVILISSYAVHQRERNQTRDLVLPKPFSLEELTDTVQRCLGTAQQSG
jgi:PAS domain S-box-containing protein